MIARLGVTKHLTGGGRAYNPANYDLIFVFDMRKGGYRSIPLNRVQELCIGGNRITVEQAIEA